MGSRGPEIILSRTHNDMVRVVFEQEIPEVANGEVQIKGIARDAGNRSKVAVWTEDEGIDPIGSCIGQRGSRITTIIDELGGEKIDVIQYNEDVSSYIKEALSPAKVSTVELSEEEKLATVHVAEDQFSLAIGRGGQNVRLAAALTGWQINVVQLGDEEKVVSSEEEIPDGEVAAVKTDEETPAGESASVEETSQEEEVSTKDMSEEKQDDAA